MVVGQWNIRGCNDPSKQKEVRNFVRDTKLSLLVLVENKVRKTFLANNCCPSWSLLHNCMGNGVGRVWILWNPRDLEVEVVSIHEQVIEDAELFISGVYAHNDGEIRRSLWRHLECVATRKEERPWV